MSLLRITWISLTLATVAMLPSGTQAGQIFTFDNAGDVTLSPTQTAGSWYTDRYAPAGFVS
ncbi:hypothetical protein, partial [Tautonia marina]|uniref:hypothetical protein n=1 Tax=Tautonia marina TaxID=2653855 RepID=UPI001F1CE5FA